MNKTNKKILAEMLRNQIEVTDKMFKDHEQEYAHIIGYLQGVIKIAINTLEDDNIA
jgi:hypothetical protein